MRYACSLFRSPWSNTYDPALEDGATPSEKLRDMEVTANGVFDVYRSMYYEGGVSSVYMWDLDEGFAAVVLIKKSTDVQKKFNLVGTWDSIHVIEVIEKGKKAKYKLTSTIMLTMTTTNAQVGEFSLAGSLTRQVCHAICIILYLPPIVRVVLFYARLNKTMMWMLKTHTLQTWAR